MENMRSYKRDKAVTGLFTFVAERDDKKPIAILDN